MTDPAFEGVGQEEGLTLWRIENKKVVLQPKVDGKFHTGDSYILLSTQSTGAGFSWKIHFWLGEETSQDEQGIAAYKAVELDDALGGGPAQYRETQGFESSQFLSYFKGTGVEYLPGGVDSGFNKVERDVYRTRLLHLKGKRVVRASEVKCEHASLNVGDVFILDKGLKLFLWNGPEANKSEKAKGVEMIGRIKGDERGGRAQVVFVHEEPDNEEFWAELGGQQPVTNQGEPDEVVERVTSESIKLHRVTDESGEAKVVLVERPDGSLTQDLLDTKDVFIVDVGHEVFVWIGRGSTVQEKKDGMIHAAAFVTDTGRPSHTPVTRLAEGYENSAFKGCFSKWGDGGGRAANLFGRAAGSGSAGIAKVEQEELDHGTVANGMHQGSSKRLGYTEADEKPVDDGSGKLQVWVVDDFQKVPIEEGTEGHFYGGDSYVCLYTYMAGGREENIIYFWQGRSSSTDEKGSSALLAKELDDEMGGRPVQVRVVQGKEPAHFRSLFKGGMVVHSGGRASGFKSAAKEGKEGAEGDSFDTDGVALFHVKGSNATNTYGVQVAEVASSLNSGDCFVLVTPSVVYTWKGKHCSEAELAIAAKISHSLEGHQGGSRTEEGVDEGAEPDAFWEALGGKGEYPEAGPEEEAGREARLFQISNATGKMSVEELENFDQEDLCNEDIMLLDVYTCVYVWVGGDSNEMEQREAMKVAQTYVEEAPDGRSKDTSIVRITAGNEPLMFSQHFRGWDPELLSKNAFVDPYEAKMQALKKKQEEEAAQEEDAPGTVKMDTTPEDKTESTGAEERSATASTPSVSSAPSVSGVFPYAELKGVSETPIPGVDPSKKEQYLSETEFAEVFEMSKAEFEALPLWKRQAKKKAAGLF